MANRYWIGNTGQWDDIAHWSETSGGVGGASKPTVNDAVYIDANSFSSDGQTISMPSFSLGNGVTGSLKITATKTFTFSNLDFPNYGPTRGDGTGITFNNKTTLSGCRIRLEGDVTFTQAGANLGNTYFSSNTSGSILRLGSDLETSGYFAQIPTTGKNISFYSNNYNVSIKYFSLFATGTIDFGTSKITTEYINHTGTNTGTINCSNATLILNINSNFTLPTDKMSSIKNLFINFGTNSSSSFTLTTTSNITATSLIIQSKNSAAHTVLFNNDAIINARKFIAIGSSASNRLLVNQPSGNPAIIDISNSCYGQFVDMRIDDSGTSDAPLYIGGNSVASGGLWLTQNPPKISTLVDPLTTAPGSNTNWTVSGTITQETSGAGGGGYKGSSGASMLSTDTFDLVDSSIILERPAQTPTGNNDYFGIAGLNGNFETSLSFYSLIYNSSGYEDIAFYYNYNTNDNGGNTWLSYPNANTKYLRISLNGTTGALLMQSSDDQSSWTTITSTTIDSEHIPLLRSVRVKGVWNNTSTIGSINYTPTPLTTFNPSPMMHHMGIVGGLM